MHHWVRTLWSVRISTSSLMAAQFIILSHWRRRVDISAQLWQLVFGRGKLRSSGPKPHTISIAYEDEGPHQPIASPWLLGLRARPSSQVMTANCSATSCDRLIYSLSHLQPEPITSLSPLLTGLILARHHNSCEKLSRGTSWQRRIMLCTEHELR